MFYFRIDKVRVVDNGGIKSGLGVFGHDFAEVKFVSFVTPSDRNLPDLDRWVAKNDVKAKHALMNTLVQQSLQTRVLTEVSRVEDNGDVSFGDTGLILYQSEEIPEEFTWTFAAIRSKRKLREGAMAVTDVLDSSGSGTVAKTAMALVRNASLANPAYAAGLAVAEFVAKVTLRRLAKKNDIQLGSVNTSFIRPLHYPMGIREAKAVQDSTGNMYFDYSIFGYKRAIPVM